MSSTWLRDHLIRQGHMTESGATRRARIRRCRRCRAQTLIGLDDDTCALEVTTDPTPLSQFGEALALLEGRRSFALTRYAGGYVLDHRDELNIRAKPAGVTPRQDVVREHRCQSPPPSAALSSFTPTTSPARDDLPPF